MAMAYSQMAALCVGNVCCLPAREEKLCLLPHSRLAIGTSFRTVLRRRKALQLKQSRDLLTGTARGGAVASFSLAAGASIPELAATDSFEDSAGITVFEAAARSVASVLFLSTEFAIFQELDGMAAKEALADGAIRIEGVGSGFVWDSFGHIITNYHVVAKLLGLPAEKQQLLVTLQAKDGASILRRAKIIGLDAALDLAVLKVSAPPAQLLPLPIGSSADLRVGQSCYALGNPRGLERTLTSGVVSGLRRSIPSPAGLPITDCIQTDAAINAGNSGGPLLDSFGRVIAVNTASFTTRGSGRSSGVNFAVAIDPVRTRVPSLIVYGTYKPRS